MALMEVPWVDHSAVLMGVRSKFQMAVPSWGCGPAVRAMVVLVEATHGGVVLEVFHPYPRLLHRRCPEEPCHRKVCDHLSN